MSILTERFFFFFFYGTLGPTEDRGRSTHAFTTGRGGVGNMVKSGKPSDPDELTAEEDRIAHEQRSKRVLSPRSYGRGGAGNIRSPSRWVDVPMM